MHATSFTEVTALAEKLSREEKLRLIARVAEDLQQKPQVPHRLSWRDSPWLGKEIWKAVEVDCYIDNLRNTGGASCAFPKPSGLNNPTVNISEIFFEGVCCICDVYPAKGPHG